MRNEDLGADIKPASWLDNKRLRYLRMEGEILRSKDPRSARTGQDRARARTTRTVISI